MSKNKWDAVKDLLVEDEILWKDRKRYLGMPISFTIYSLDQNRLYLKKGLLNTTMDELLLYRVLDVKLSRSLGQKIFGVGSITLVTADQTNQTLVIKNIKDLRDLYNHVEGLSLYDLGDKYRIQILGI